MSGASGSSQIGRGVQVTSVEPLLSQGSFQTTSNGLDLAIDGSGFFTVNDGSSRYYTRAGQFALDKDGNIVNPDGMVLQGYLADNAGNITGTIGSLQIATRQSAASQTAQINMAVNLNASAKAPVGAFTLNGNGDLIVNDPANYNFSTTATVYDSQGGAHQITAYFVKTADNAWDVHYAYEDPANPGQLVEPAVSQQLTFDSSGALIDDNSATAIDFDFGTAVVSPQAISFNYGTGTGEPTPGTGLDMSTQFSADSSVMSLTQDGYGAGSLKNVSVSDQGVITGVFTNGQTRAIGQLALTRFIAPTQLTKMGRNLYAESYDSGQPIVGTPNTSGLGKVASNSLELSNVDLAEEFVKMITAQRGFEANSKVITTTDQLMQVLVNMR